MQEPLLREVASRGGGRYANAGNEAALRDLGEALVEPATGASLSSDEDVPLWGRYDVAFVLGLGALFLVVVESLLDVSWRGRRTR